MIGGEIRDMDDKKSTTGFIFYMRNIAFIWMSMKQLVITLYM